MSPNRPESTFPKARPSPLWPAIIDGDGWTDLLVGNDGVENWLLRNNHHGGFTNIAAAAGVAFAQDGASIASMGIDCGDYMNEDRPGIFIADWSMRPDHLWRNQGNGAFLEVSSPSHVGDIGFPYLGFGAGFIDYDNDGWLDHIHREWPCLSRGGSLRVDRTYLQAPATDAQ